MDVALSSCENIRTEISWYRKLSDSEYKRCFWMGNLQRFFSRLCDSAGISGIRFMLHIVECFCSTGFAWPDPCSCRIVVGESRSVWLCEKLRFTDWSYWEWNVLVHTKGSSEIHRVETSLTSMRHPLIGQRSSLPGSSSMRPRNMAAVDRNRKTFGV